MCSFNKSIQFLSSLKKDHPKSFVNVYTTGLGYVRQISVCLTSSAVISVPCPIVLLPEVLLAVSAVPGVPGALSAVSVSALF